MRKILFLSLLVLLGCSSNQVTNRANEEYKLDRDDYLPVVEAYSTSAKHYSGFQNIFSFHATVLNTKVYDFVIRRRATYFEWSLDNYRKERTLALADMQQKTKIFISFYAADDDHNDLNNEKSVWKIYLDSNGNRYSAKIEKVKDAPAEILDLYPYFDRWSKGYLAVFSVPTSVIENFDARLVITGPAGEEEVNFPKLVIGK